MATIEELKQEAKDLGIKFVPNISAEKLATKIEEFYQSQETSDAEILQVPEEVVEEKSEEKSAVKGKDGKLSRHAKAKIAEENANKTRVITIIDNDTRENNQTTVAVANCSNLYFDLGTVYIPLNVPVEVRQGHINVLKELEIPLHTKNPKTGLSETRMRPRYTISYEDIKTGA